MKVSRKKATTKVWITYDEGGSNLEFLIRSIPKSLLKLNERSDWNALALQRWNYSVCDWKGFDDEDTGEPWLCTTANKKFMFDHFPSEITDFVDEKIRELDQELVEVSKN